MPPTSTVPRALIPVEVLSNTVFPLTDDEPDTFNTEIPVPLAYTVFPLTNTSAPPETLIPVLSS